ncbi:GNAT family N-acetyltransferase [Pseudonocardia sp. KRD291]|uniref:GNAT family N-acetyltransferase n=1 Tax=Pseudonocardia sp. KRD291 TaxID=2792007 RepID=UPI001C4A2CAC|nr:GNAT family N-acetyltransferase [Pseudonocardia sp. KRD291]MBW0103674.1 GNAT family N-acetyltransferase [Pseudonocardia sp. KRD291]
MLRVASVGDVTAMQAVERAAGEPFRGLGMDAVADDEPPAAEVLRGFVDGGRAWVAESGGAVVAYLVADVVDGCGHVEQVSVHPDHAGHRCGAALVEHLAAWSRQRGHPALTLTTYRDVPWNGPYYARCGFRALNGDELGPGLRTIRADEAARGLDRWPRIAMRRELRPGRNGPLSPTT